MSLLVVSYPEITHHDADWIQALRQRHGYLRHSVLAPHFTLVFPLYNVAEDDLLAHIQSHTAGRPKIRFVLRSSLLIKDDSSDMYYVMLVPDEGFSGIVRLHDTLYTGMLAPKLRLDLPFIPHVTIGGSLDVLVCKSVVDALNSENLEIQGEIANLHVVQKEAETARTVRGFALA